MMEAASTSETLAKYYQTTWRYNPEDSHLEIYLHFRLKTTSPTTPLSIVFEL
jgi:hypothetical protein